MSTVPVTLTFSLRWEKPLEGSEQTGDLMVFHWLVCINSVAPLRQG